LWGVDYRWTDHTGTRIYSCDRFCGKVRVKEIERNIYMVYSINFTGKVGAKSAKEAARKACGELEISGSTIKTPKTSRGGSGCR
ncbi:MAG: hypothetical protein GY866_13030, partial [Proteobacteria bacterium]|nr:hypothetical protein [Pseudomonadota bacterium]